jgi:hypothetical protein
MVIAGLCLKLMRVHNVKRYAIAIVAALCLGGTGGLLPVGQGIVSNANSALLVSV